MPLAGGEGVDFLILKFWGWFWGNLGQLFSYFREWISGSRPGGPGVAELCRMRLVRAASGDPPSRINRLSAQSRRSRSEPDIPQSRRIFYSSPGPIVSPACAGTTVARASELRRKW